MSAEPESADRRELMKRALARIKELEQRLESPGQRKEPIAIVGVACRFPGGVTSPDEYWQFLSKGGDAIGPFPADRLGPEDNAEGVYGGFIEGIDQFDPAFFGITPREARSMDPQQRLLLETTWQALEDAGQAPDELLGSRTGVFVGITTNDYGDLIDDQAPDLSDVYVATGNALNAAAGRLSFVLGLQGPCMALDTACSSSLVAVHLACRSLNAGDCTLALAGGVNVVLQAAASRLFAEWGMMARDGRCKTFDAAADGFVRSEGCGVVALRRLSDARARGDRILAVIAGSAVNQDGRSSGLTVPNGPAQQALIGQALEDAGIAPSEVDYVEAHGTGTSLGDPIEIEALARALGAGHTPGRPLLVGSVKTNIGHAEAASGIAGLIKVVLALQHGNIPAHLHFKQPSPAIPWNLAPIEVVTSLTPWPIEPGGRRCAGVSSFGFSGTNAHVIVADPPIAAQEAKQSDVPQRSAHVLTISARHSQVLERLADAYAGRLITTEDDELADVCYTANVGRARLAERLAVVVSSSEQARNALSTWVEEGKAPSVFRGTAKASGAPRLAFLFTGQGSQYVGMGRGLFESNRVFRQSLEKSAALLAPHLDRPLLDLLFGPETASIDDTKYAQPALFAIEFALAELWRSLGIVPDLVMGHSVGEFVAATVAGAMSLEDALRLIATRGRLMQALPREGAMAAVFADSSTVAAALAGHEDKLAIAAVNGPRHTVISGTAKELDQVLAALGAQSIRHTKLTVSHAFHSPLMDPMLDEFEREARAVSYRPPACLLISNVTGNPVAAGGLSAGYWRQHARFPVQFLDGIQQLKAHHIDVALELGPAPVLTGLAERILSGSVATIEGLKRDKDDWLAMCEAMAKLHVRGARIDWSAFDSEARRKRVALPLSPFERHRCWIQSSGGGGRLRAQQAEDSRPLLGRPIVLAARPGVAVWETDVSLGRLPFLADHRVQNRAVYPATAYAEMVLAAAADRFGWQPMALHDLDFKSVLVLTPESDVRMQVTLEGDADDLRFVVHSRPAAGPSDRFVEHMSGRAHRLPADAVPDVTDAQYVKCRARCHEALDGDAFYEQMAEKGNDWGPSFQGTRSLWVGAQEACAVVVPPTGVEGDLGHYIFHPALSDACGHVLAAAALGLENSPAGAFVGRGIDEIRVYRPARGASFRTWAIRQPERETPRTIVGDVRVIDDQGQLVSETLGASLQFLDVAPGPTDDAEDWHYEVEWEPVSIAAAADLAAPSSVIAICEDRSVGDEIVRHFRNVGVVAEHVDGGDRSPRLIDRHEADEIVQRQRRSESSAPCHVIYVTAATDADAEDVDDLERDLLARCGSVLHLAQALTARPGSSTGRLWIVTRRAAGVGDEPPALSQAPLWALGRSLAIECGTSWGGLVDFDPALSAAAVARELGVVLEDSKAEDQLAFRGGWHAPRLVRRRLPPAAEPLDLDLDAAHLVTGGLGGLGLVVAEWLADRGVRHLVLVGRKGLPERERWDEIDPADSIAQAIRTVRRLEERGVVVRIEAADVGSSKDLARVIQVVSDSGVRLRGVIHAAGVPQYEPLQEQTLESFRQAFAGKLRGAWLLDRMCGRDLKHFVLFSSASAILSSPFAGAYAAANAFLDALALNRASRERRVLSVSWGMWGDVGMVARFDAGDRRGGEVSRAISPRQGIVALERALASDVSHTAVLPIDWREWRRQYGRLGCAPFLSRLVDRTETTSERDPTDQGSAARREIQGDASTNERVCAEFERVMDVQAGALEMDVPLISMGLDSLMAVELRAAIESSFGVTVPLLRFLEGATVRDIVSEVASQMEGGEGPSRETPAVLFVEEGEI